MLARSSFLLILLISSVSCAHLPLVQPTQQGPVEGFRESSGVTSFLGIPYAQPPLGLRRWKTPAPHDSWSGLRPARKFSRKCLQPSGDENSMSEDCLALNIWTPAQKSSDQLPVMVWIHGGGFWGGSGNDFDDQGALLAKKGVVVVTFNYRLGVFGFFGSPELSSESPQHVSGNYGLLDQIEALRWVKQNIQNFGGNPQNVTIFGESAGGTAVADLMASPLTRALFHRAIAQSGYANEQLLPLTSERGNSLEKAGQKIIKALGCDKSSSRLDCLRTLNAREILQKTLLTEPGMIQLGPIVDGFVLKETPATVFKKGQQARVPTIIGVMQNEEIRDPGLKNLDSLEKYKNFLLQCFPKNAKEIFQMFPASQASEIQIQAERILTHVYATTKARSMARSMSQIHVPVFLYHFSRVPPFAREQGWGAFHSLDVAYVFQTPMTRPEFADLDFLLSDQIQNEWSLFAKNGNPSSLWKSFTSHEENYFEIADSLTSQKDLQKAELDLIDRVEIGNCTLP